MQIARGTGRLGAFACFLVAVLEGYDIQSFGVAAPVLGRELGLSAAQLGYAGSAAMFGLVFGAFGGGSLAGRWGPKPVLILSMVLFGIFSLATAFADSVGTLIAARFATGLGFGAAMPNLIAVATQLRPGGKHAALTTAIFCGMPAGGALVSLFAGAMEPAMNWRLVFAVGGILPLLLIPVVLAVLPSFRAAGREHVPASLKHALFSEGRWRVTLMLWTAFILTLLLLNLLLNWLPALIVAKEFSGAQGATASLAFNLCAIPVALLLGVLADRNGYAWPMAFATMMLVSGIATLVLVSGYGSVIAAAGLMGGAVVGAQYLLYAFAPLPYPGPARIVAAGVAIGIGRIGSIAGPLLAGSLRQSGFTPDGVFLLLVPIALFAGATSLLAYRLSRLGKAAVPR